MGNHLKRVMVPVRGDLLETVKDSCITVGTMGAMVKGVAYVARRLPIGTLLMVTPTNEHPTGVTYPLDLVQVHVHVPAMDLVGWVYMRSVKIVQRTTENVRRKKRARY
jgi:hypothetical protein